MRSFLLALVAVSAVHSAPAPSKTVPLADKQYAWERSGKFEGDMVLTAEQSSDLRNGLLDEKKRWPDATIPYRVRPGDFDKAQEAFINATLELYNQMTCVRVRPAVPAERDYVLVTGEDSGCWSSVGRVGGEQQLNLHPNNPGEGCLRNGTVLHEFLHALGFFHLQSSTERDDYVTIVWENIEDGKENNFQKYEASYITNFNVTYDYDSVLHYSEYAFSMNGERTIVPRDPSAHLGQRLGFSDKDILKLERMYKCR